MFFSMVIYITIVLFILFLIRKYDVFIKNALVYMFCIIKLDKCWHLATYILAYLAYNKQLQSKLRTFSY